MPTLFNIFVPALWAAHRLRLESHRSNVCVSVPYRRQYRRQQDSVPDNNMAVYWNEKLPYTLPYREPTHSRIYSKRLRKHVYARY